MYMKLLHTVDTIYYFNYLFVFEDIKKKRFKIPEINTKILFYCHSYVPTYLVFSVVKHNLFIAPNFN